jgi:cation transport ATPase
MNEHVLLDEQNTGTSQPISLSMHALHYSPPHTASGNKLNDDDDDDDDQADCSRSNAANASVAAYTQPEHYHEEHGQLHQATEKWQHQPEQQQPEQQQETAEAAEAVETQEERRRRWRRTAVGVGLGQVAAGLLTGTAVTSAALAARGIGTPSLQAAANYVLLLLCFLPLRFVCSSHLDRSDPAHAHAAASASPLPLRHIAAILVRRSVFYAPLAFVDVEANYLIVKAYQYTDITR